MWIKPCSYSILCNKYSSTYSSLIIVSGCTTTVLSYSRKYAWLLPLLYTIRCTRVDISVRQRSSEDVATAVFIAFCEYE